jgi:hypothetical protein
MEGLMTRTRSTKQRIILGVAVVLFQPLVNAETYVADPDAVDGPTYYLNLLNTLEAGDTLVLPAGTYRNRLNLTGIQGTESAWITITGPEEGPPAIITTDSNCCNNVQLGNTAYVALKNLTIDANSEGVDISVDAINAKGGPTHDILIEDCVIQGAGLHQQTVGISTKSTAWNWTVRGNVIRDAGTGAYFGSSDGSAPFIAGTIERNLFVDTIGYNLQIKHQNSYTPLSGMPTGERRTIIRDNVFLKRRPQSSWPADKVDGPRPNLLVDGFPDSGTGSNDRYEIFGNFFYQNQDDESLLQASGTVSVHDNIFVGQAWTAIYLTDHNRPLRSATVYSNTIYATGRGIRFASRARDGSRTVGNMIFADIPISGSTDISEHNLELAVDQADGVVTRPSDVLNEMDFYPLPGEGTGTPIDATPFNDQTDFALDFNGMPKGEWTYRGAYAGAGQNPGWQLTDALKGSGAQTRPRPPQDLTVN